VDFLPVDHGHERISPTAWGVAYARTHTDIPYSREIFAIIDRIVRSNHSTDDLLALEQLRFPGLAPMFEARYKLANLILDELNATQVLEIAAGFTQRGIVMAENPAVTYVEMDLPNVAGEKRAIVDELRRSDTIGRLPNFHVEDGNALSLEDVERSARHFGHRALAIVNEGLLRYLSHEEKAAVARNIRTVLQEFGGAWITPDVAAKGMVNIGHNAEIDRQDARTSAMTGIDLERNKFENEDEARRFFEDMGFTIERRPFSEVFDQLVSPGKDGIVVPLEELLGKSAVYVMRP
jgi:O-methyltransferase involved in polyketide biosynthesis